MAAHGNHPPDLAIADLAAQLPMLIRGFYFEAWNPTGKPVRHQTHDGFIDQVGRRTSVRRKCAARDFIACIDQ